MEKTIFKNDGTTPVTAEFLNDLQDKIYPVGSIYLSVNSTNPSTIFGGTWERIAKGCALVGLDENDSDFNKVEKIIGKKTHKLTVDELPTHNHSEFYQVKDSLSSGNGDGTYAGRPMVKGNSISNNTTFWNTGETGGSKEHNNIQPSLVVYIWKRIA